MRTHANALASMHGLVARTIRSLRRRGRAEIAQTRPLTSLQSLKLHVGQLNTFGVCTFFARPEQKNSCAVKNSGEQHTDTCTERHVGRNNIIDNDIDISNTIATTTPNTTITTINTNNKLYLSPKKSYNKTDPSKPLVACVRWPLLAINQSIN